MLEFSGFVQLGDTSRCLKLHKQLTSIATLPTMGLRTVNAATATHKSGRKHISSTPCSTPPVLGQIMNPIQHNREIRRLIQQRLKMLDRFFLRQVQ